MQNLPDGMFVATGTPPAFCVRLAAGCTVRIRDNPTHTNNKSVSYSAWTFAPGDTCAVRPNRAANSTGVVLPCETKSIPAAGVFLSTALTNLSGTESYACITNAQCTAPKVCRVTAGSCG